MNENEIKNETKDNQPYEPSLNFGKMDAEDCPDDPAKSNTEETIQYVKRLQITTIALVMIILLLLLTSGFTVVTQQVGLVALIEPPSVGIEIPDWDPTAITPPEDDTVSRLNEKLDKGKMCVSMISAVTFTDASTAGYLNFFNDPANNYPQFVTLLLDSDSSKIYQSGLVEPGKCIMYDTLDVELAKGEYECTALFTQVDTETNSVCGQAAAKIHITIQN